MTNSDNAVKMAEKFRDAEEKVARERGEFYMFGLFERDQMPGKWDLVASAPWLKTDRDGTLDIIVALRDKMETEDWKMIGGVFPLEASAAYVEWITSNYRVKHHIEEVIGTNFTNVHIGHAFIITSDPSPSQITAQPLAA